MPEKKEYTYFISYRGWSKNTNFTGRVFWITEFDLYSKDECQNGLEIFEKYLKEKNDYEIAVITNFKKLI